MKSFFSNQYVAAILSGLFVAGLFWIGEAVSIIKQEDLILYLIIGVPVVFAGVAIGVNQFSKKAARTVNQRPSPEDMTDNEPDRVIYGLPSSELMLIWIFVITNSRRLNFHEDNVDALSLVAKGILEKRKYTYLEDEPMECTIKEKYWIFSCRNRDAIKSKISLEDNISKNTVKMICRYNENVGPLLCQEVEKDKSD